MGDFRNFAHGTVTAGSGGKTKLHKMKTLVVLAETDLATGLGKVVGLIQSVSMVILVASLVVAGVSVTSGRIEYVKYGIIGGALAALAWVLVKALFSMVGTDIPIEPQSFR